MIFQAYSEKKKIAARKLEGDTFTFSRTDYRITSTPLLDLSFMVREQFARYASQT